MSNSRLVRETPSAPKNTGRKTTFSARKTRSAVVRAWLLFFGWLILALFLSRQPADASSRLSSQLSSFLYDLASTFQPDLTLPLLNHYLRKLAHVFVHFVLGLLAYRAAFLSFANTKKGTSRSLFRAQKIALLTALALGLTSAALDEIIQLLAPGRGAIFSDFILNALGATLGLLSALFTF